MVLRDSMTDAQSFIKDVQNKQEIMSLINDTQVQIGSKMS